MIKKNAWGFLDIASLIVNMTSLYVRQLSVINMILFKCYQPINQVKLVPVEIHIKMSFHEIYTFDVLPINEQ